MSELYIVRPKLNRYHGWFHHRDANAEFRAAAASNFHATGAARSAASDDGADYGRIPAWNAGHRQI